MSTHEHESKCSPVCNISQTANVFTGGIVYVEHYLGREQHKMSLLLRTTNEFFCSKLKISTCVQTTGVRSSELPNHHQTHILLENFILHFTFFPTTTEFFDFKVSLNDDVWHTNIIVRHKDAKFDALKIH